MKYLNVFDSKDLLDASVNAINHKDGAFVFGVKTESGIENITIYDERHPGANCFTVKPVNMDPLTIDESSIVKSIAFGTILYSTADGKLVLDETTNNIKNTPIAIACCFNCTENYKTGEQDSTQVKTAKFVSLNYMDYEHPGKGTDGYASQYMGNYGTVVGADKGNSYQYVGGKYNTQKYLDAATKQDSHVCAGVTNQSGAGYSPAACCCAAYSTLGTKPGDWYLPSQFELSNVFNRYYKTDINKARTKVMGSNYDEYDYWSSSEKDANNAYYVSAKDGSQKEASKMYSKSVLAFLSVEYPQS